MKQARAAGLLVIVLAAGMSSTVAAQHRHGHGAARTFDGPVVVGDVDAMFRIDGPVASDFTANRRSQMNIEVAHLHFGLFANPWLSLQGAVKGEPLRELRPNRSEAFRGFGVFMAELYVNAELDWATLFAGKFMPTFGQLWDHHKAWGLFSVDFTEDYETLDFLGAGFVARGDFGDRGLGRHELTAQVFFADTTFLHRSIITAPRAGGSTVERQSRLRKSDGGVGNTGQPNNFSVTLDSTGFEPLPHLGLHVGYRFLHRSRAGVAAGTETRSERGIAIGLDYTARLADVLLPGTTTIQPALEWVQFRNAGGNRGTTTYWTANLIVGNGDWTWHLTGTLRHREAPDTVSARDQLLATSVFYRLDQRWQVGAGYKYQRVRDDGTGNNTHDHVVGIKAAWNHDFAFGLR